MNPLGIMRESVRILVLDSSFFIGIALGLIYPLSAAIILSHAFVDHIFVTKLAVRIQAIAYASNFPDSNVTRMIHLKVSQTIASYIFCLPFIVTFSLLAKASVAHTIAYIYAGSKPSGHRLIVALPKIWKPIVVTYSWVCLIILGSNGAVVLFMLLCMNLLSAIGVSSQWVFCAGAAGVILYSIVFAHVLIICNLATIVSAVEDCYGIFAVFRANFLIGGRTQIGLLIAIMTNLSSAFVESLFQYRVMGKGGSLLNDLSEHAGSILWECPLLIFIYSLVALMDAVMSCVFYYTCKSSKLESFRNCSSLTEFLENEAALSNPSEIKQKLLSKKWVMANQP
eukprot:Gb_29832 [translate_table: standard]